MKFSLLLSALVLSTISCAYNLNERVDFDRLQCTPQPSAIYDDVQNMYYLGWFDQPFDIIKIHCPLKRIRKKRWQYFSFASEKHIIGMAVIDLKYACSFFIYDFDVETGELIEFEHNGVIINYAKLSSNSKTGITTYNSKRFDVRIENHLNLGYHTISFDCVDKQGNRLNGNLIVYEAGEPLVNSREVLPKMIVYTHQNSMYRPEGRVVLNGKEIFFNPETDFSTMDYTIGLHTYRTNWNWAAAGGYASDGTKVAINFAKDIGRGTNTVPVYWIDGVIYRVSNIIFYYPDIDKKWIIKSPDGAIDLIFEPIGKRAADINLLVLRTKYTQPIGYFSGTLRDVHGKLYHIEKMIGVAEEHFAKW